MLKNMQESLFLEGNRMMGESKFFVVNFIFKVFLFNLKGKIHEKIYLPIYLYCENLTNNIYPTLLHFASM